ncbi:hypothetical protein QQX98_007215 [Neonectria punicea]|uniref:Transcription factor domain-containing protein n=1 Tax=Neonectria punicea TaxID=979145 RepID=A0ABR1GYF8_9HYPO
MEDSPGSGRPHKRVKYARHQEQHVLPASEIITSADDDDFDPLNDAPFFDGYAQWQPTDFESPSQVLLDVSDMASSPPWPMDYPAPQLAGPDSEFPAAAATTVQTRTLSRQVRPPRRAHRLHRLLPAIPSEPPEPHDPNIIRLSQKDLCSPFTDHEERLVESSVPRYIRPENGQVNGYVKFNWPTRRPSVRPTVPDPPSNAVAADVVEEVISHSVQPPSTATISRSSNINNWCPGRSVLSNTNLWLTDFANMQQHEGVLCAIQSLAGVYIYDYTPNERIRRRINERYIQADEKFRELLARPESYEIGKGSEVITMAVVLSMQDIVLTERRLKKPHMPRWLAGFKQGEHFLQMTDPGGRFWQDNNIQLSSLRVSQSIIVGRAMILAQPMMELPSPDTLDPVQEASRFAWLLYGTPEAMYEIHGGCGFSKKLLHTMSQITYCSSRVQQDPLGNIVPMTARYLLRELTEMRQWSRESETWKAARKRPPLIEWIRTRPDDYVINTHSEMTDATAEAWRLPRNHSEVLSNMNDLARCIRIMPTSGSHFTAQAPLLPVFFLGLLATEKDHEDVAEAWFEEVVRTPVRSSVPPLYQALKRIRTWIDTEIELPSSISLGVPKCLGMRYPWWELFVAKVREKEEETLCLT